MKDIWKLKVKYNLLCFLRAISILFYYKNFLCALLRKRIPTEDLTLKRFAIECAQKLDFISNSTQISECRKILSDKVKPLLLFIYVTSNNTLWYCNLKVYVYITSNKNPHTLLQYSLVDWRITEMLYILVWRVHFLNSDIYSWLGLYQPSASLRNTQSCYVHIWVEHTN